MATDDSVEELPSNLTILMNHIESAIGEINEAVVTANDLEYSEVALWLEWIAEELRDMLLNVMQSPPME